MLSHNSVARLLEGVADALDREVAARVDDDYALMQLRASCELLRNMAPRVDWAATQVEEENRELELLLGELRDAGVARQPPGGAGATPVERHRALLEELREALARLAAASAAAPVSDETRGAVERFLRSSAEREVERLRRGMYR